MDQDLNTNQASQVNQQQLAQPVSARKFPFLSIFITSIFWSLCVSMVSILFFIIPDVLHGSSITSITRNTSDPLSGGLQFTLLLFLAVLVLNLLIALFKPIAKLLLFAIPILVLLISIIVFFILSHDYGGSLENSGKILFILLEYLIIFVSIATFPIIWVRTHTEDAELKGIFLKSLPMGFLFFAFGLRLRFYNFFTGADHVGAIDI